MLSEIYFKALPVSDPFKAPHLVGLSPLVVFDVDGRAALDEAEDPRPRDLALDHVLDVGGTLWGSQHSEATVGGYSQRLQSEAAVRGYSQRLWFRVGSVLWGMQGGEGDLPA